MSLMDRIDSFLNEGKQLNESRVIPNTAKNKHDGKEYHVISVGRETALLVPKDGTYSDKKRVIIGDFYEDYDLYDHKGKQLNESKHN